jgi:hypothetical protein
LPWFIHPPCEQLLRRVAQQSLAIQIETREKHDLSILFQQLTQQHPTNVRTVEIRHFFLLT